MRPGGPTFINQAALTNVGPPQEAVGMMRDMDPREVKDLSAAVDEEHPLYKEIE